MIKKVGINVHKAGKVIKKFVKYTMCKNCVFGGYPRNCCKYSTCTRYLEEVYDVRDIFINKNKLYNQSDRGIYDWRNDIERRERQRHERY